MLQHVCNGGWEASQWWNASSIGLLRLGSGVIAGIVIINGLTMCLILALALSFSLRELTNFSYLREKSSKSNLIRNGG